MQRINPSDAERIRRAEYRARLADEDAVIAERFGRWDAAAWLRKMAAAYRLRAEALENGPVIGTGDR